MIDLNQFRKEYVVVLAGICVILAIGIGVQVYFTGMYIKDKIAVIDYNEEVDIYNKENKWYKDLCYITYISNITVNSSFSFNWTGYITKNILLNSSFSDSEREKIEKIWNEVNKSINGLPINCYRNVNKTEIAIRDRTKHREHKEVNINTVVIIILSCILLSGISIFGWCAIVDICFECKNEFPQPEPLPPITLARRTSVESLDTIAGVIPVQGDSTSYFEEITIVSSDKE